MAEKLIAVPRPEPDAGPRCETCPRWLADSNGLVGRCRLTPPFHTVVGIGQGLGGAQDAKPVTVTTYRMTAKTDQCFFHPEILYTEAARFLNGLVPVIRRAWELTPVWTRDGGFTRAPSLKEAQDYAPGGPKGPRPVADSDKSGS